MNIFHPLILNTAIFSIIIQPLKGRSWSGNLMLKSIIRSLNIVIELKTNGELCACNVQLRLIAIANRSDHTLYLSGREAPKFGIFLGFADGEMN